MLKEFDLHNLGVHDGEEVAEGRDAALVDEVADLVGRPARAGVGDRPGSFLSRAVKEKYALKYSKALLLIAVFAFGKLCIKGGNQ